MVTKQAHPQLLDYTSTCYYSIVLSIMCIGFAGQVSLRAKNFWDKVKSASLLTYEWYALKELKSGTNA